MGGLPKPCRSVMRSLQAENPLVPKRIMTEANILNLELLLSSFPFRHPGEMCFIELLTKFGDFDLVRIRENNSKHGDPASYAGDANRGSIQLAMDDSLGKAAPAFLPLEWRADRR